MGFVNVGLTKFGDCHRSLESIHPLFDADTPLYLVVDTMTMDKAEYDVDVRLGTEVKDESGNVVSINDKDVAVMWKSYPENGKIHVNIDTEYDGDTVVRKVTCRTESYRIYTKIYRSVNHNRYIPENGYNGPNAYGKVIYFDALRAIGKTLINPSITPNELGITPKYANQIFDSANGGIYNGKDTKAILKNNLAPEYADYIISNRAFYKQDYIDIGQDAYPAIPIPSMEDKIRILSKCYDIESLANVLYMHIYGLTTEYSEMMASECHLSVNKDVDIDNGEIINTDNKLTIFDVIAIYKMANNWTSNGWVCNDTLLPCENPYTCNMSSFNRGLVAVINESVKNRTIKYDGTRMKLYTDFRAYDVINVKENTNPVNLNIDNIINTINTLKIYTDKGCTIEPNHKTMNHRFIVERHPYGGLDKVNQSFTYNDKLIISGDIKVGKYSEFIATVTINDNYILHMNVKGTDAEIYPSVCELEADICPNALHIGLPYTHKTFDKMIGYIDTLKAFKTPFDEYAPIYDLNIYGKLIETLPESGKKSPTNPSTIKEVASSGSITMSTYTDSISNKQSITVPIDEPLRSILPTGASDAVCDELYSDKGVWKIRRNIMKYILSVVDDVDDPVEDLKHKVFVNDQCVFWIYDEARSNAIGKRVYYIGGEPTDDFPIADGRYAQANFHIKPTILGNGAQIADIVCPKMEVLEKPATEDQTYPDYGIYVNMCFQLNYELSEGVEHIGDLQTHCITGGVSIGEPPSIDDERGDCFITLVIPSITSSWSDDLYNFLRDNDIYFYGIAKESNDRPGTIHYVISRGYKSPKYYDLGKYTGGYLLLNTPLDGDAQRLLNALPIQPGDSTAHGKFFVEDNMVDTYTLGYVLNPNEYYNHD